MMSMPEPGVLFASIVWGMIGMSLFRIGRKREEPKKTWVGVALMVYPYFITNLWLLYGIGIALCSVLFIKRI